MAELAGLRLAYKHVLGGALGKTSVIGQKCVLNAGSAVGGSLLARLASSLARLADHGCAIGQSSIRKGTNAGSLIKIVAV